MRETNTTTYTKHELAVLAERKRNPKPKPKKPVRQSILDYNATHTPSGRPKRPGEQF